MSSAGRHTGAGAGASAGRPDWTFLTNHGHVLLALARNPESRLRDVAELVGITERAVQSIVGDLEAEGYLTRTRIGRRNAYRLHTKGRLRHPAESDHRIGELLELFAEPSTGSTGPGSTGPGPSGPASGKQASAGPRSNEDVAAQSDE